MTISLARLLLDRHEAGHAITRRDFDQVPAFQFDIYFTELAPHCPDRREMSVERRPGNALNVEIGAPTPRCMGQSPDGRGAAWVLSGGSLLAYGPCECATCPRLKSPASSSS